MTIPLLRRAAGPYIAEIGSRDPGDALVHLCVAVLHRHFEYPYPVFIGDDYSPTVGNLSSPSRRFLCRFVDIGDFNAFLIEDRHLTAFDVKVAARLPPSRRNKRGVEG